MAFAMSSLLVYEHQVPHAAREAILAARRAPPAGRRAYLMSAARILHDQVGIECADALELVDLPIED